MFCSFQLITSTFGAVEPVSKESMTQLKRWKNDLAASSGICQSAYGTAMARKKWAQSCVKHSVDLLNSLDQTGESILLHMREMPSVEKCSLARMNTQLECVNDCYHSCCLFTSAVLHFGDGDWNRIPVGGQTLARNYPGSHWKLGMSTIRLLRLAPLVQWLTEPTLEVDPWQFAGMNTERSVSWTHSRMNMLHLSF